MTRVWVLAHRWMGILVCLFFPVWFLSGMVMIYHPFPSLSEKERLTQNPAIDSSRIKISPGEAIEASGVSAIERLRLVSLEGRPVYLLYSTGKPVIALYGDNGKLLEALEEKVADRIARQFSDKQTDSIEGPIEYDQWIVHEKFNSHRPFYRVRLKDSESTDLYVSRRTGEVLQKTRGSERAWNYVGAVVHWIYPTVLRRHWALWDQTVWWLSLIGTITVVAGIWLGVARWRYLKHADLSTPITGWLERHYVLGLWSGVFVFTWIMSGWLSMDHGRLFSSPSPNRAQIQKFQGISLREAVNQISASSLRSIHDFTEIEFLAINGKPFALGRTKDSKQIYTTSNPEKISPVNLTSQEMVKAVESAWPGARSLSSKTPGSDDAYAHLREGSLPDNTLRIILDDPSETWVHVNMETGQIVSVMDRSRRLYRWLFNGLHSLDFPGFTSQRPLWDMVILLLLSLGFIFSVTGLVIGWKRIIRNRKHH